MGLVKITVKDNYSRSGIYYEIYGYFPESDIIQNTSELFGTYIESRSKMIRRKLDKLTDIQTKCCEFLDLFYFNAQVATNRNTRYTFIGNPVENKYNIEYDPECLKIIQNELRHVDNLRFRTIDTDTDLWWEPMILVWNWQALNIVNDKKLHIEQAPELWKEFKDEKYII